MEDKLNPIKTEYAMKSPSINFVDIRSNPKLMPKTIAKGENVTIQNKIDIPDPSALINNELK
jgi:hypothetical protein